MDDWQLIQEYVGNHSEAAFRDLVTQHVNHVHATALRLVRDSQTAEDVTQAVFILLARKAASLSSSVVVAGWLYRTTQFVSSRALRAEQRRKQREEEAFRMTEFDSPDQSWQRLAPLLDEALDQMGQVERDALILRFFQNKPFERVGHELGLSEEAARKRVVRALEKVRGFFARRGFTIAAAALAAELTQHTTQAAPAALGGAVASAAIAHSAAKSAALPSLVREAIEDWRWGRIRLALGFGSVAVVSVSLLLWGFSLSPRSKAAPAGFQSQTALPAQASAGTPATNLAPSSATALGHFSFRALDARTGLGIARARVLAVVGQDQDHIEIRTNLMTDEQGRCDVPLNFSKVMLLLVGALADGYEERCVAAGGGREEIPVGYDLRLRRGSRIGGIVQDEAGHLLAGAEIYIQFYGTGDAEWREFQRERPGFPADDVVVARTDESGRWSFGSAPATNGAFWIEVKQAGFPKATFRNDGDEQGGGGVARIRLVDLQAQTATLVLKRGLGLQGQVVDESDRGVGGASVSFSGLPGASVTTAQTGPDGFFELKSLPAGAGHVTVTLEGFAPERLPVQVGPTNPPVLVRLNSGALLKVRVVDEAGAPVEHARVQLQGWRGPNTLEWGGFTDAEGRVTWASAPADQLDLVAYKEGFFYSRDNLLVADGQEHLITLHPQMTVSGLVTDEVTKAPVPSFKVIPGSRPDSWQRINSAPGTNGQYQLALQEYKAPLLLRFEADGYEPAISDPLALGTTQLTCNVELKRPDPNAAIQGLVWLPDGRPAAGAQVALCTSEKGVTLGKKQFLERGESIIVTADAQGHFRFPAELNSRALALVAVHDQGFSRMDLDPTNHTLPLQLQRWGRIEGRLNLRHGSNAGKEITFFEPPMGPFPRGGLNLDLGAFSTRTDDGGNFVFEQVPPGDFYLYLVRGLGIPFSYQTPVEVRPGETLQAQIGGTGRTIKGQLALTDSNRSVDWSKQMRFASLSTKVPRPVIPKGLTLAEIEKWQAEYWRSEEVRRNMRKVRSFPLEIGPDGSFTIDDVLPGTYELSGQLTATAWDPTNPDSFRAPPLASIQQEVTVPDATDTLSSEGLDLGRISVPLR